MYTIQEADRVKEVYCDCPAFRSYSGICKHCVAVLLEYGDRKAYERVEARRQQDQAKKAAKNTGNPALLAAASGAGAPATKTTVEPTDVQPDAAFFRRSVFWPYRAGNLSEV